MRWAQAKRAAFAAVKEGDVETVRKLVDEHPDLIRATGSMGDTLLHAAAYANQIPLLELLTELGMDVNAPAHLDANSCFTALHRAAETSSLESAVWLLDHGALLDAGIGQHATPLITAVRHGHRPMIELLLQQGADINAQYTLGEGPSAMVVNALRSAVIEGHTEVIALLLERGASEPMPVGADSTSTAMSPDPVVEYIRHALGPIDHAWSEVVAPDEATVTVHVIRPTAQRPCITLAAHVVSDPSTALDSPTDEPRWLFLFHLPSEWPISRASLQEPARAWPLQSVRLIAHHFYKHPMTLTQAIVLGSETIKNLSPPAPFDKLLLVPAEASTELSAATHDESSVHEVTILPLVANEVRFIDKHTTAEFLRHVPNGAPGELASIAIPSRKSIVD